MFLGIDLPFELPTEVAEAAQKYSQTDDHSKAKAAKRSIMHEHHVFQLERHLIDGFVLAFLNFLVLGDVALEMRDTIVNFLLEFRDFDFLDECVRINGLVGTEQFLNMEFLNAVSAFIHDFSRVAIDGKKVRGQSAIGWQGEKAAGREFDRVVTRVTDQGGLKGLCRVIGKALRSEFAYFENPVGVLSRATKVIALE